MRHQAIKSTALMLGVLLLAAGPAQAGPIAYGDVISLATVFGSQGNRTSVDLRLRSLSQQQGKATAQQSPSTTQDGKTSTAGPAAGDTSGGASGSNVSLTGTEIAPQQTETTVTTIQVGEVDGTICDCGPILRPGGFPLWPLLGLAAVPLFFLPEDNPPDEVFPTPTPTVPPPQVPEPATLLLLGTGLLAAAGGARRRRRQSQLLDERGV